MESFRVIVLQHAAPEAPGILGDALNERGAELEFIRPFAGERVPSDIGSRAGLVVLGGPMGVSETERYPHLRDEMKLIERALSVGCPVLGICLGSQLLAHVLGARVAPGAQKEIGWHKVTLTEAALHDPAFKGLESSFIALHWHGDVFSLPAGAASLASSALTQHQAYRYGTSDYGILFHMEPTLEIVKAMTAAFPDELAQAGLNEEAVLAGAREHLSPLSERGQRVFGAWADMVAERRDSG